MTVDETLRFIASFRQRWNRETEADLLGSLPTSTPARRRAISPRDRKRNWPHWRGPSRAGIARVGTKPTSGLDPIVRREFIQTVIGAYHAADPEHRNGFCLDPSHRRIRKADRPVHQSSSAGRETAHHAGGRGAGPVSENPRQLSPTARRPRFVRPLSRSGSPAATWRFWPMAIGNCCWKNCEPVTRRIALRLAQPGGNFRGRGNIGRHVNHESARRKRNPAAAPRLLPARWPWPSCRSG